MAIPSEETVRAVLQQVIDPEAGMNVVDLGLVYEVHISAQAVRVRMTMTTPACPMGSLLTEQVEEVLRRIVPTSIDIAVELVWDPPWSPALMSDAAKAHFGWQL